MVTKKISKSINSKESLIACYDDGERKFSEIDFSLLGDFENENLENAVFFGCYFGVSFLGSNLHNTVFVGCNLKSSDFTRCDFSNAEIRDCLVDGLELKGSNILNLMFEGNTVFGTNVSLNRNTQNIELKEKQVVFNKT